MEIIQLGNDLLRQKSLPVMEITDEIKQLVAGMFAAMDAANGVGLAAPQVGVLKRLFVITLADKERRVFINPAILETSLETECGEEGCLSIRGVYHDVARPKHIKVQALGTDGRPFTLEASGALARAIQHEHDHLEGILYIDHLDEAARKETVDQFVRREERRLAKRAQKNAKAARIAAKQGYRIVEPVEAGVGAGERTR
ncbi:MAG: peptide deformylase [Spirochaetaceae bacterium]|jgi:peptide deformylase|nr:peptide deformylase [Spirochaetaceae bacterium]